MKLRNKETGGLANMLDEQDFIRVYTDAGWADYYSLASLNAEWETYKPKEPLIKDEKIRKAVRAWAEACGIEKCHYDGDGDFATRWHGIKLDGSQIELDDGHYSIDELCGEEEE